MSLICEKFPGEAINSNGIDVARGINLHVSVAEGCIQMHLITDMHNTMITISTSSAVYLTLQIIYDVS